MVVKEELTDIFNKKMDRQEFLKSVAISLIALSGAGVALKLILQDRSRASSSASGYGISAYGGSHETKNPAV